MFREAGRARAGRMELACYAVTMELDLRDGDETQRTTRRAGKKFGRRCTRNRQWTMGGSMAGMVIPLVAQLAPPVSIICQMAARKARSTIKPSPPLPLK